MRVPITSTTGAPWTRSSTSLPNSAPSEVERSLRIRVNGRLLTKLHRACEPAVEPTWPLRPPIDVISRELDGTDHAPVAVVDALRAGMAALGIEVADGATYPLHPSTLAFDHMRRLPGRVLCVEVRRDLLADPFVPFAQQVIGAVEVEKLSGPFVSALRRWW